MPPLQLPLVLGMTLSFDFENLFSNEHAHDIFVPSLIEIPPPHYVPVQRCVSWNSCSRTDNGRTAVNKSMDYPSAKKVRQSCKRRSQFLVRYVVVGLVGLVLGRVSR